MEKKPKKGIAKLADNFKEKIDETLYYAFFRDSGVIKVFVLIILVILLIYFINMNIRSGKLLGIYS